MDVKFSTKKLTAIEYPGTVLNLDKMVKTLNGEAEMWNTFNQRARRLELKFRPDDVHCKCVYGDRIKTTNLVLKVTKRVKKHPKKGDTNSEPCFKMEFLGVANNTFKFQSLVDFQVLPIVFDKQQDKYKSLLPDIVPNDLHPLSWLKQEVDLFISPLMYSRFDCPQSGYVEMNKAKTLPSGRVLPENIIGRCRKRRAGFAVFQSFENKDVPSKPQDIALKQLETHPLDFELKSKVDECFRGRPIWSKNALLCSIGCDRARLKYTLPCSAYYFTNGPWRTLWCKFGYDPRKNPSAKQYQVMDLRIHPSIPLNDNKNIRIMPRIKSFAKQTINAKRYSTINPTHLIPSNEVENTQENDTESEQLANMLLCTYIPGELPPVRQCFYQLCDVLLDSVQTAIHQNDGREEVCHERDGWCELGTLEKCRELIIADIIKTMKEKEDPDKSTE